MTDTPTIDARPRARARVLVAMVAAIVVLAACGGGDGDDDRAAPSSSSTSSTARASTTTAEVERSTTTTTRQSKIKPGDTVGVRCEDGIVKIARFELDHPRIVYSVDMSSVAPDWVLRGTGGVDCTRRSSFSADFSALVFEGRRTGQQYEHIGYVDLATGGPARDLTEPRQTTGFSAPSLVERQPAFLGGITGDALTLGTTTVAFSRDGKVYRIDVASPGRESEIPGETSNPNASLRMNGHPELTLSSYDATGKTRVSAPMTNNARTLLVRPDATGFEVGRVAGGAFTHDPCDSVGYLGWSDDSHLVVWATTPPSIHAMEIRADGSVVGCGPNLLPSTDRRIDDARLYIDGTAVEFSSQGPEGDEYWRLKLTGGAPAESAFNAALEGWQVFRW